MFHLQPASFFHPQQEFLECLRIIISLILTISKLWWKKGICAKTCRPIQENFYTEFCKLTVYLLGEFWLDHVRHRVHLPHPSSRGFAKVFFSRNKKIVTRSFPYLPRTRDMPSSFVFPTLLFRSFDMLASFLGKRYSHILKKPNYYAWILDQRL